jgi:hypothetical protein
MITLSERLSFTSFDHRGDLSFFLKKLDHKQQYSKNVAIRFKTPRLLFPETMITFLNFVGRQRAVDDGVSSRQIHIELFEVRSDEIGIIISRKNGEND